jgi:Putative auto-transporter adhesin, head GIN domain
MKRRLVASSVFVARIGLAPVRFVIWVFATATDLALGLFPTGVVPGPGKRQQRPRWATTLTASQGVAISAVLILVVGAVLYVSRSTSAELGSGRYVAVVRSAGSFNELVVGSAQQVKVRVEPGAQTEITVYTDDNLVPLVRTRHFGGRLVIDTERPISQAIASEIRIVTGAAPTVVVVNERAVVEISGLEGSSLTADVSDGGRLAAAGTVARVDLRASASRVDFQALVAVEVAVEARDGAVISLHARETVTGDASGGSEVRVIGGPTTLNVEAHDGAMVCEGSTTVAFSCRN